MQNLKINKGEVIVLTTGEYSSYGIDGFIIALKDFDMALEAQNYTANQVSKYPYGFVAYLIIQQLAMPVQYREIDLGNSKFNQEFGVKY